jgi:hypothetical protein
VKQKPKRKPRGKMKPIAPEMTRLAFDLRLLKEFSAAAADEIALAAGHKLRKMLRSAWQRLVVPGLLEAVKRDELSEVARAIKRLPKETDSQRNVRSAYQSLCLEVRPPYPTFKALMQRLHERADGKTDSVPPERTVRYVVKMLRLPLAGSKTGRRFAVKRLN